MNGFGCVDMPYKMKLLSYQTFSSDDRMNTEQRKRRLEDGGSKNNQGGRNADERKASGAYQIKEKPETA